MSNPYLIAAAEANISTAVADARCLVDACLEEGDAAILETLNDLHAWINREWNPIYFVTYAVLNHHRPETRH